MLLKPLMVGVGDDSWALGNSESVLAQQSHYLPLLIVRSSTKDGARVYERRRVLADQ
jgi:hypothetical protein